MVQGWPLGSTVTVTGCTGVSLGAKGTLSSSWYGVSGAYWNVAPGPTVKLEVGKLYRCKEPITAVLNKPLDTCIKVFGPIKNNNGIETVRIKYWDPEFKEWDLNLWVKTEQTESAVEEIGRLEALVVYGAIG